MIKYPLIISLLAIFIWCCKSESIDDLALARNSGSPAVFTAHTVGELSLCKDCKENAPNPNSFGFFLTNLPLQPPSYPIHLYNGQEKTSQAANYRVLKLDIGHKNLLQCADAVIRLRADYLWNVGAAEKINFRLANGQSAAWIDWRDGARPKLEANDRFSWKTSSAPADNNVTRLHYLEFVYAYANTVALQQSLPKKSGYDIQPGDIFLQSGYPGHAIIVLRVAQQRNGQTKLMLAQSYMPAQEIHILKNQEDGSPWFTYDPRVPDFYTPDWQFQSSDLHGWN